MIRNKNEKISLALIDDNNDWLEILSRALKVINPNYDIYSFDSAILFLSQFRDSKVHVDIIISDYNMPEMNGLELAKELDSFDSKFKPPVILVSNTATESTIIEALHSNIECYLEKTKNKNILFPELHHIILKIYEKLSLEKLVMIYSKS